jgi:hypothetical protein
MGVFKRSDYNTLVDNVNSVIADPNSTCATVGELPHADPNTILKVRHFQTIRDAIDEYAAGNNNPPDSPCGPLTWNKPANPLTNMVLWFQKTVDEINSNLAALGDCDCEPCDNTTCRTPIAPITLFSSTDSTPDIHSLLEGAFGPSKCISRHAVLNLFSGSTEVGELFWWDGTNSGLSPITAATRVLNMQCDGSLDLSPLDIIVPGTGPGAGHTYAEYLANTFDLNTHVNNVNGTSFLLTLVLSIETGGADCVKTCP